MRKSMIAVALAAAGTAAGAQTPHWQFYQDSKATNGLVQAFVQSADGSQLILKCEKTGKGQVYAIIVSPQTLAPPFSQDIVRRLDLRFDDGATKEDRWRYRDKTAKALDKPGERTLARFLEQLKDAKDLHVWMYPSDTHDPPFAAEFDVHDAADAVAQVYTSCKDINPIAG
ncbi:MAG TPA: hypothetical protein VHD89_10655 [Rhodanobacteraceae bacterium]|nr:hypothetical protein [Rhodanobacteraceae bacterium]